MKSFDTMCLKTVRWSSWPLLVLLLAFLLTGYTISGRYGLGVLMDEKEALALHKLFHLPLITLSLAHCLPAIYLAMIRWGWIRK